MFRLTEPSSDQNHSTGTFSECIHYDLEGQNNFINSMGSHSVSTHWMYQYYGFGLMMAQWAETCRQIFNSSKINYYICCVTDKIYLL